MATHPVLRPGSPNVAEVKILQTKLQDRGYYVGQPIDGSFGIHTEEAVKDYQYHRWCNHPNPPFTHQPVPNPPPPYAAICQKLALTWPLAVDGVVGFNTWARLDPLEIQKGSKGPTLGPYVTLCQALLNYWGATPPLALDGDFGQNTYDAVMAFQKAHNIKQDGIVGPITWGKLQS
jgi:peptidoglycan hydrolase-like protein with peptidoglycan-binding domain